MLQFFIAGSAQGRCTRVGGRQLADAVAVEMLGNVLAVVLRVDLPEGLEVLQLRCHVIHTRST